MCKANPAAAATRAAGEGAPGRSWAFTKPRQVTLALETTLAQRPHSLSSQPRSPSGPRRTVGQSVRPLRKVPAELPVPPEAPFPRPSGLSGWRGSGVCPTLSGEARWLWAALTGLEPSLAAPGVLELGCSLSPFLMCARGGGVSAPRLGLLLLRLLPSTAGGSTRESTWSMHTRLVLILIGFPPLWSLFDHSLVSPPLGGDSFTTD